MFSFNQICSGINCALDLVLEHIQCYLKTLPQTCYWFFLTSYRSTHSQILSFLLHNSRRVRSYLLISAVVE